MKENEVCSSAAKQCGRARSATMLKLGELAERLRKVLAIKQQVESGNYNVESDKLAEALLKKELR